MSTYVQCICNLNKNYYQTNSDSRFTLTVTRKRRLLVGFVLGFFLFGYFWWGVEINVIGIIALMIITL